MVVEQAAFVGGFSFDPAPAGEVDGMYSFLRHSVDEGIGVEAEVNCIRVQVMQVEEQVAVCHSENFAGPIRLAQLARGRIDQGRDVFDEWHCADDLFGGGQIPRGAFDRRLGSWRCGEMTDLQSTASDKG